MKIGNKPDLQQTAAAAKQAPKSATTVATEESTKGLSERAAGVPVSFSSSARALDSQSRTNKIRVFAENRDHYLGQPYLLFDERVTRATTGRTKAIS